MAQQSTARTATQTKSAKSSKKQDNTMKQPLIGVDVTNEEVGDLPEHSFWDDLKDIAPPWLDEIAGIILMVFGILSFIALFYPTDAIVSIAWANILTSLFGDGSLIISGGLFALGVLLWLPKAGIEIKPQITQILAIEIIFLCILAIFHLLVSDAELRAVARAGEGGGLVGWGLSLPFYWLLGRTISILLFVVIIIACVAVVLGIRRNDLSFRLRNLSQRFMVLSQQMLNTEPEVASGEHKAEELIALSNRKNPLMRIRVDQKNLPPSLRRRIKKVSDDRKKRRDTSLLDDSSDLASHPLFGGERDVLVADFNVIGEKTGKKDKQGFPLVERPDGRIKRYFSVEAMKESTKVGRRSKILPDLSLMQDVELKLPTEDEINHNVVLIENTLLEFDIDIDVVEVQVGPTVTRYAVQPFKISKDGKQAFERTRLSKIASYANDLSLALSAKRLRLETPVPGTNYMGIEVPNKEPSTVALRSVFESKVYYEQAQKKKSPLFIPIGRDVAGQPIGINLGEMPHLLIAGTTGSGKSVAIAAMATALLLNNHPDDVKMVMLDPKMVELSRFNHLPHLLGPVETENERIIGVLKWCTQEMDRRYRLLEEHSARNIDIFNSRHGSRRKGSDHLPYIVIFIDEIGDLMMSQPEETERYVTRLAQMARAVGMHLVVATQRPSVDVITGLIKANFPSRIAFSVASGVDSRVILDTVGAETLLGKGDMLYLAPDAAGPRRIQGCFVSDEEVRDIVEHWKTWHRKQIEAGKSKRIFNGPWERGLTRREFLAETDPMLEDAIELVVDTQEASASVIQRTFEIGYPRAARIMDMMEELGIVGEVVGGGRARKVLIPKGGDPFKQIIDKKLKQKY